MAPLLPTSQLAVPHVLLAFCLAPLLSNIQPCVAFMNFPLVSLSSANRRQSLSTISSLRAGVNGDSTGNEVKSRSKSFGTRRKLVDRSSTFYTLNSTSASIPNDASPISNTLDESRLGGEDAELCYLDDMPGTDAGQTCFVSDSSSLSSDPSSPKFLASLPFNTRIPPIATDLTLRYLPFVMPLVAYSTYEPTAKIFEKVVEYISNNNWVAVDGGQYQANIITPAINGLIVPSIALLFATMMSNTINTLRQRQLQIRTNLNTEANDLRMLSTMVDSLPTELREIKCHLREYLIQYASRVIAESRPGLSVDLQMFIGSMDNELNGFLVVWNKLSMASYGTMYVDTMLPAANYTINEQSFAPYQDQLHLTPTQRQSIAPFLSPPMFSETYDALTRLRHERSARLSALQSTYPILHYGKWRRFFRDFHALFRRSSHCISLKSVILSLLAGSICTVFLMETNQASIYSFDFFLPSLFFM
ncbi:hypothetical protein ACHAWF_015090 [Thalassiosira exigua]